MTWQYISEIFTSLKWAFAGLIGAMIVSFLTKRQFANKREYLVFVASGAAIAHYLTAPVAAYFSLGADSTGGVGFLLGAFGGSLMQATVRAIQNADVWELVKRRWGQ